MTFADMKLLLLTIALLLIAAAMSARMAAQAEVPYAAFRFRLYVTPSVPGGAPIWESGDIPMNMTSVVRCGLDPVAGVDPKTIAIGPLKVQWDDPVLAGKACLLDLTTAPQPAIPDGIYELALVGTNPPAIGTTESNRILVARGAVTIKVIRGVIAVL